MKKNLLLSLALCTVCATAVQAGSETILFNSTNTKKYPYRIPAITTMSNGEIIAISDYRPGGKDVGNSVEVDIYARISNDNGTSWTGTDTPHDDTSDYIKIADGTSSLAFGDAAVAAHPTTGEVLVISVGGGKTAFTSAGSSTNDYYCYRHYSNDYGRTWETHDNITSQFKGTDSKLKDKSVYAMFFASGRLLVSRHTEGRIYGALLTKESGGTYNYVFYTEDFGLTWNLLGSDYAIEGADEAKLEELPNGDIVISSRATGGRIFNVYSMNSNSWGKQQAYTFASNCKATNGELILYEGLYKVGEATGQTYDVLLQSLPIGSSRKQVSVFYKEVADQAYATSEIASGWTKGIEVYSGNSAYSAMTIQPDSKIGFLYEKDYYTSNIGDNYKSGYASGGTANITYIPYTIEELTGNTYTTTAPVVSVDPTISLTAAATTLTVGGTTQLTATTNSDGAVTYTSSDERVATVSADGVVTAKAAGTATITANVAATANYNAASATVTITVESNEGGNEGEETSTYEVTAVGGKIGSVSYYIATFSANKATIVPSGVKAYYVKVGGSDVVTLTRISSGKVIPANQGVILISSTQTFIMTSTNDASNVADLTGNLMVASLDGVIPTGSYVLAVKGSGDLAGQFAFCLTSSELKLEKGNRAYLKLPSNAPQMRMRIEDESTDIEDSALTSGEAPVIYDLTGRRVTEMLPGRIYIVNGKKIVN